MDEIGKGRSSKLVWTFMVVDKYGNKPLKIASDEKDEEDVKALLAARYTDIEEKR